MIKYDILIHSDDRWLLLQDDKITRKQPYPVLKRPTLVITDFNQAASGMIALEGNHAHATPLILKRLRGDGLIDQDAKIIIHQHKNAGRSYQALYTAVEMDEWQRMLSWTENQQDHCLLFTRTTLLWANTPIGAGTLYIDGRHLIFMANLKHHIIHASAIAFGTSQEDLELAIRSLAERVRDMLANRREHTDNEDYSDAARQSEDDDETEINIKWTPCFTDSLEASAELAKVFSYETGLHVATVPAKSLVDEQGLTVHSTIPALAAKTPLGVSNCSRRSLWMARAEQSLPWACLASILLAIALVSQATNWTLTAKKTRSIAQVEKKRIPPVQERLTELQSQNQAPADFAMEKAFIERSLSIAQKPDPVALINILRQSSTEGIRILRMYINNHASTGSQEAMLIIEGVVDPAGEAPVDGLLARFVGHLRYIGYQALPIDSVQSAHGSRVPAGYFSYHLRPLFDANTDSEERS